jgi:6,7-dimethyl-8-ribityllumazine synthase
MAVNSPDIFDTKGIQLAKDAFVVIVRTDWNAHVVDELEKGCILVLSKHNIRFNIIRVPGAVEICFAIKHYWENSTDVKPDAFIALGCVIRGDTPHFDYVCKAVTDGVVQLNLLLPVPTIFGVLTVNDQVQADERTGGRNGHKGEEGASAAIRMIALSQSFKK